MKHMFGKSQHRFTKGELHLTNLIAFHDKVTCLADVGQTLDIAYMDFFKAFNAVSHCLFLEKLVHCGLMVSAEGGELTKHNQRVLENISFSNCQPDTNAVPQGSQYWAHKCLFCSFWKMGSSVLWWSLPTNWTGKWTIQTGESFCRKTWIGWKRGLTRALWRTGTNVRSFT